MNIPKKLFDKRLDEDAKHFQSIGLIGYLKIGDMVMLTDNTGRELEAISIRLQRNSNGEIIPSFFFGKYEADGFFVLYENNAAAVADFIRTGNIPEKAFERVCGYSDEMLEAHQAYWKNKTEKTFLASARHSIKAVETGFNEDFEIAAYNEAGRLTIFIKSHTAQFCDWVYPADTEEALRAINAIKLLDDMGERFKRLVNLFRVDYA